MDINYFKEKVRWGTEWYQENRETVTLFGLFFLVVTVSFAIGYLSASDFGRAVIKIEACSVLDNTSEVSVNREDVGMANVLGVSSEKSSSSQGEGVVLDGVVFAIKEAEAIEDSKKITTKAKEVAWCDFGLSELAKQKTVILNEVAWMGSEGDANDEWIEIKNIMPIQVNLAGWQIQDKGGQIKVSLPEKILSPGERFVLSRKNERVGLWADMNYSGVLGNSNEEIKLFNGRCELADEVRAGSSWPAGDNKEKRSMERGLELNWHTYNGRGQFDSGVLVMATPGRENSLPPFEFVNTLETGVVSSATGSGSEDEVVEVEEEPVTPRKILINCVAITGGVGKTKEDFIELYNPNSEAVNLKGYRLVKRTKTGISDGSIKSWTGDEIIEANGFYVWANSDFQDIDANTTTSATLSNDNGVAIRFGPANSGEVIDGVAWGEAENDFIEGRVFSTNPVESQKMCRSGLMDTDNNAVDFEIVGD